MIYVFLVLNLSICLVLLNELSDIKKRLKSPVRWERTITPERTKTPVINKFSDTPYSFNYEDEPAICPDEEFHKDNMPEDVRRFVYGEPVKTDL